MAQPQRAAVKIAVVGDAGSGKTSLISTTANDTFDARPAPVLPPTRLPAERTPDYVPMIVTDTSSRPEDQQVRSACFTLCPSIGTRASPQLRMYAPGMVGWGSCESEVEKCLTQDHHL